ncbi:transcriptional regulator [Nocardioides baekrokdamisoli]|uniref:Transcriptional regulator n=1 Tax=Nocardioides baekrokdamisoli TaxID=1804624 RepID=A0A3G9IEK8_9ACTN|nr:AraC family transcriptional regulator [Nocardioides baekrokdamisoli]BBH16786.1 transcriptional regulator [Nocardioides baekrokdamisoli]
MDWLSHLVAQARPRARLDERCLLSGDTHLDNPPQPAGVVPFHLLLEGSCVVEIVGTRTEMELAVGDLVLLPTGDAHKIRVVGPASARIDLLCGHFEFSSGAGRLLFRHLPNPMRVSLSANGTELELGHISSLLRIHSASELPGQQAVLDALAQMLFVIALRAQPPGGEPQLLAIADPALRAALAAVIADPGAVWTIDTLAEAAHMSRATLVRRFRDHLGIGVADFITWARMMKAADLLRTSGGSVSAVASATGYNSTAGFTRVFQRTYGISPARYARAADDTPSLERRPFLIREPYVPSV